MVMKAPALLALAVVALGCRRGGPAPAPAPVGVVGDYYLDSFVVARGDSVVDLTRHGAAARIRLGPRTNTTGALQMPGGAIPSVGSHESLRGVWRQFGDTLYLELQANTILRELAYVPTESTLAGELARGGATIRVVFRRGDAP